MKTITIKNMKMRNFKGFKEFELNANDTDLTIFGETGSGKTTVFDAFWYVLFGKNSQNKQDFPWKPLDEDNNPLHHLETEVEMILTVDEQELKLTRMTKENWTKKRGFETSKFTGHTTTYRVDDLKKSKADFNKVVAELIDEESFKQLTNIYYVPEVMDKKERRKMLFELSGDLSDQAVIESDEKLAPLTKMLEGRSIDDKRSLISEEETNLKKQIKEIAIRIDEADRFSAALESSLTGIDKTELEKQKEALQKELLELEQEISSFINGSFISNKRSEIQTERAKLETKRSDYQVNQNKKIDGLQKGKQESFDLAMDAQNAFLKEEEKINKYQSEITIKETSINLIKEDQEKLRNEFFKVRDDAFPSFDEHKTTCQFCGQEYPPEEQGKIKISYETEAADFNVKKAQKLEEINKKGVTLNENKSLLEAEISDFKTILEVKTAYKKAEKKRDDLKAQYEAIQGQIKTIQSAAIPFEDTKEFAAIDKVIKEIELEVESANQSSESELLIKKTRLNSLKAKIEEVSDTLYQFVMVKKQEQRKDELIAEEKMKSVRYGELEKQLFLLDEFVRTKVALLTDKINSQFQIVEWKLFDTAINGGLEEVCEPTVEGRPFTGGLSNGERINAGADIVNTLSRMKEVKVPIFIDNAEGVTNWKVEVEPQLIQLIAIKDQKELKIESKEMAGVA
ncbi:AAA family ATPase [Carnobacterium pleistocenium]|uniref:AAA family ATPase n=1 Tax=Carnobacterium pleistocenium TaxID=181073 RepID=UPI000558D1FD|nr:AAA family ATPase [Carnobacterium pleistocenium]